MPIDPKQLEEWKALQEEASRLVPPRAPGEDLLSFHRRQAGVRAVFTRLTFEAVPALIAEAEQLRVLLRELEWPGDLDDCHFCDGHAPSGSEVAGTVVPSDDGRPWRVGHAPDCRLAALLR